MSVILSCNLPPHKTLMLHTFPPPNDFNVTYSQMLAIGLISHPLLRGEHASDSVGYKAIELSSLTALKTAKRSRSHVLMYNA